MEPCLSPGPCARGRARLALTRLPNVQIPDREVSQDTRSSAIRLPGPFDFGSKGFLQKIKGSGDESVQVVDLGMSDSGCTLDTFVPPA